MRSCSSRSASRSAPRARDSRSAASCRSSALADRVVVEIAKRGKLVVGEPYFVPGVPLVLDRKGLGDAGRGDLAVVSGDRGRRARRARTRGVSFTRAAIVEAGALRPTEPGPLWARITRLLLPPFADPAPARS